jgi:hypothetical protein
MPPAIMMPLNNVHFAVSFTPEEVASLEPRLPMPQGASSVELRIRSVPVTVASKHGYVESPEDLTHKGQSEQ